MSTPSLPSRFPMDLTPPSTCIEIDSPLTGLSFDSRGRIYSVSSDSDLESPRISAKVKVKGLKLTLSPIDATPPTDSKRKLSDISLLTESSPETKERQILLKATCGHEAASLEIASFLKREQLQVLKDGNEEPILLGKGNFSHVYLVQDQQGIKHALKIFQLNKHKAGAPFKVNDEKGELVTVGLNTALLIVPEKIVILQEEDKDPKLAAILYPYVEGPSLKELTQKPLKNPLQLAKETILPVKQAHDLQILHRDIKPENFIKKTDGPVILLDFGIAEKGCISFQKSGTELFFSPERFHTGAHGFPADCWSLGLTLYELATGKLPYEKASDIPRTDHADVKIELLGFPEPFVQVVSGLLRNDPKQRLTAEQAYALLEPTVLDID